MPIFFDDEGSIHPINAINLDLQKRGWEWCDLAFVLGLSRAQANKLESGRVAITPSLSLALDAVFGRENGTYLAIQLAYDLDASKRSMSGASNANDVRDRARLMSVLPIREMILRQWLPDTNDMQELEQHILKFFDAETYADLPGPIAAGFREVDQQRAAQEGA